MDIRSVLVPWITVTLTILLSGCSDYENVEECPAWFDPIVEDFKEPEWDELIDLAERGCTWSFLHGSNCASDFPVLFARQGQGGFDRTADWDYAVGNLANGIGECKGYNSSGCKEWSFSKFGCASDVFEECKCTSLSHPYCDSWFCASMEVEHRVCYEADWTEAFGTVCETRGGWPYLLNASIFEDLWLAATGRDFQSFSNYYDVVHSVEQASVNGNKYFIRNDTCFQTAPVEDEQSKMPSSSDCQSWGWRYTWINAKQCHCARSRADDRACEAWHCEVQRLAGDTFGRESWTRSVCMEAEPSNPEPSANPAMMGPGVQCGAWHQQSLGVEIAEVSECRAWCSSPDFASGTCGRWVCTFYGLPRIEKLAGITQSLDDEFQRGIWLGIGRMWWLTFAHSTWFSILFCLPMTVVEAPLRGRCGQETLCWAIGFYLVLVAFFWFLYMIFFVRDIKPEHRVWDPYGRYGSRVPVMPWLGLLLQLTIVWVVNLCFQIRCGEGYSESASCMGAFAGVITMLLVLFFAKCGFIGSIPILLIWLVYMPLAIKSGKLGKDTEDEVADRQVPEVLGAGGCDSQEARAFSFDGVGEARA